MESNENNYLQQISELGETQSVICSENILTADGAKLLPKGAPINRQVLKRLVSHKLLKPIDFSIRVEDAVDTQALIRLGISLLNRNSQMGQMLRMLRSELFVRQCCARIHLETPIQNKLTVAQQLRPELLEHSLRVCFAITIIGEHLGLPESELDILATAGMLHDVGELHLNVGNLPKEQGLDLAHWQQLRSHPLVGATILEQLPNYRPHTARAVREHHERLDGTGYPKGLKAIRISRAGRLLAFTEMTIGALQKYSLEKLDTIIKSNLDALDPQPVMVFRQVLQNYRKLHQEKRQNVRAEAITTLCQMLSGLLHNAEHVQKRLKLDASEEQPCQLGETVNRLNQGLRRAGIDPESLQSTLHLIHDDQTSLLELEDLLRETVFQLRKALLEAERNSTSDAISEEDRNALLQWINESSKELDTATSLLR